MDAVSNGFGSFSLAFALDSFLVAQEAAHHSPRTLHWYSYRLERFLAFLRDNRVDTPNTITTHHCRAFLVALEHSGASPGYTHGYAQAMKTFCRFLHNEELAEHDPMARVAMPKVPKRQLPAFTPDDVHALLAACHTDRDKAVVLCLLDTGCRSAEFVALTVGDVDIRAGTVRIVSGKGGKDRTSYLGGKARRALVRYLRQRGPVQASDPL